MIIITIIIFGFLLYCLGILIAIGGAFISAPWKYTKMKNEYRDTLSVAQDKWDEVVEELDLDIDRIHLFTLYTTKDKSCLYRDYLWRKGDYIYTLIGRPEFIEGLKLVHQRDYKPYIYEENILPEKTKIVNYKRLYRNECLCFLEFVDKDRPSLIFNIKEYKYLKQMFSEDNNE